MWIYRNLIIQCQFSMQSYDATNNGNKAIYLNMLLRVKNWLTINLFETSMTCSLKEAYFGNEAYKPNKKINWY